jgi:hypothetical protein
VRRGRRHVLAEVAPVAVHLHISTSQNVPLFVTNGGPNKLDRLSPRKFFQDSVKFSLGALLGWYPENFLRTSYDGG